MVEVIVQAIAMDQNDNHFVILRDVNGSRGLPILVGPWEARAIDIELQGYKPPRPMTHDLLRNILEQVGARVRRVVVTELRDMTYFAIINVEREGVEQDIDARPSDAIALALRCKAPIYVADKVLEEAGAYLIDPPSARQQDREEQEEIERFRSLLDDAGLDDLE